MTTRNLVHRNFNPKVNTLKLFFVFCSNQNNGQLELVNGKKILSKNSSIKINRKKKISNKRQLLPPRFNDII